MGNVTEQGIELLNNAIDLYENEMKLGPVNFCILNYEDLINIYSPIKENYLILVSVERKVGIINQARIVLSNAINIIEESLKEAGL